MSPADADSTYQWSRRGRTPTALVVVGVIWLVLAIAYFALQAAGWIVGFIALFTLPALYDLVTNPDAGFRLNAREMSWYSGNRSATLRLSEIDHMRLDTRLDFSVRATAVLSTGRKIRLPFESTPPHAALESACHAQGLATRRHHFSPIG
ncbi:MAG: hypothetical protein AB8B58_06945 [Roseobacter sp.]